MILYSSFFFGQKANQSKPIIDYKNINFRSLIIIWEPK